MIKKYNSNSGFIPSDILEYKGRKKSKYSDLTINIETKELKVNNYLIGHIYGKWDEGTVINYKDPNGQKRVISLH